VFVPCLLQRHRPAGGTVISLGHRLLDDYLELVAARSRPNTVLASAYDLKVFFSIIGRDPVEVDTASRRSSRFSVNPGWARRWCGLRTASRVYRRARLSVDWRRSPGFMST